MPGAFVAPPLAHTDRFVVKMIKTRVVFWLRSSEGFDSVCLRPAGTCNVKHSLPSMMHYGFLMMEPQ